MSTKDPMHQGPSGGGSLTATEPSTAAQQQSDAPLGPSPEATGRVTVRAKSEPSTRCWTLISLYDHASLDQESHLDSVMMPCQRMLEFTLAILVLLH